MNNQNSQTVLTFDIERFVSRVSLLNPQKLDKPTRRGLTVAPRLPILDIHLDEPVRPPRFRISLMAIDKCDLLFFDVEMGDNYYCNVANPADPAVYQAMQQWDTAGFMRVRLKGSDGFNQIGRDAFTLEPILEKAFKDTQGARNHLDDVQDRFRTLLQPGVMESFVAMRTMRQYKSVRAGFLTTQYSHPGLPEASRN